MKNKVLIILIGGAAAIYYFLRGKISAGTNLIAKPLTLGIDLPRTSLARGVLAFKLKLNLINTSNFSVNVKEVNISIQVNNARVGNIITKEPFIVLAKSEKVITLGTTVQIFDVLLIDKLKDILLGNEETILKAVGYIDTDLGKIGVGFEKTIN
jgi:LEA14-like dessication related protein